MPAVPTVWRHLVLSTRCRWLHGDPRGFRSRGHRLHSSGDYRDPPPAGEHEELHGFHRRRSGEPVSIPPALRPRVLDAFVARLREGGWSVAVASLDGEHLHALATLPVDPRLSKRVVGDAKRVASRAVRAELPGSVWGAGGGQPPVRDRAHFGKVVEYILRHAEAGAQVWRADDGTAGL